jgi:hypothetical protein
MSNGGGNSGGNGGLLKDEAVQAAFDWLRENSDAAAAARAIALRREYQVKQVYSKLFLQASGPVEARKALACSHEAYIEACNNHADAEGRLEAYRDARNKAMLIIEAWRTQQSTDRSTRSLR